MKWIVAYDIRQDRGRRRVAHHLERIGFRRQKSVFEGEASPAEIAELLAVLAEFIEPNRDVVTAWPTCENGASTVLHRGSPRQPTRKPWEIL